MNNPMDSTLAARRELDRMDSQEAAPELSGRQVLEAAVARHKLTIDAAFVPFSQSRNKANKHKSLNWRVTLKRDGRDVLTTDYSAGIAHCPGYKLAQKYPTGSLRRHAEFELTNFECEAGRPARYVENSSKAFPIVGAKTILPDAVSVIWSICQDSDMLDHPTFEQWAPEFGYDPDSRSGEAIYRDCLEIALKLRAGLGEAALMELREAGQDF